MKNNDKTSNFEEENNNEGGVMDQLDRLNELENTLANAQSAIDAAKSKTLILNMTFTNRD